MSILVLLVACSEQPNPQGAVDRLVRVSMALRGVRPTLEEMEAVARDEAALPILARGWLLDPRFGDTIRDMHAEQFLTRTDTNNQLPAEGPLLGTDAASRARSIGEEPLRLIEWVVRTGRPYTEILTADYTLADPLTAAAHGVAIPDPSDPSWQVGQWTDGRPTAGILSSTTLWQRHMSGDTNHHRRRAKFVLDSLLCDPLPGGSVVLDPTVDNPLQAPGCAGCHQKLDPIASAFFGFERYILGYEVAFAYEDGCPPDQEKFCYPLRFWHQSMLDDGPGLGMPAPALDGVPVSGVVELGQALADDPRFAECTVRRFASYLYQLPLQKVPDEDIERFLPVLLDSGWDVRELALAMVLDEGFSPQGGKVERQLVRAEQFERMIEALTGYVWDVEPPEGYGTVRLGSSDEFGLRALMGGLNGWDSILPTHHPMPTRELAMSWGVEEAASYAVDQGRWPPGGMVAGELEVREALRQMHKEILGELEPDIEPTYRLWKESTALTGDPVRGWKIVGAAMMLDHSFVTY